jgi:hypothetical protein
MSRDPIGEWIDQACEVDQPELDIDEFDEPMGPPLTATGVVRVDHRRRHDPL